MAIEVTDWISIPREEVDKVVIIRAESHPYKAGAFVYRAYTQETYGPVTYLEPLHIGRETFEECASVVRSHLDGYKSLTIKD